MRNGIWTATLEVIEFYRLIASLTEYGVAIKCFKFNI